MVAQPRNLKEAALVQSRLYEKYPQMFKEGWGSTKRKKKKVKAKETKSVPDAIRRHRASEDRALNEALTGDEIKKLIGR